MNRVKCAGDTNGAEAAIAGCRALWEAMERFDEAAGRTLGVGRTDLRALNLLESGPLSAGEIGERLGLTSGSVTALIERLAGAGHVTRQHPPEDRRRVLIELTSETFAAFVAVYAPLGAGMREAVATLSPEQRAGVAQALAVMTAAFDRQRRVMDEAG